MPLGTASTLWYGAQWRSLIFKQIICVIQLDPVNLPLIVCDLDISFTVIMIGYALVLDRLVGPLPSYRRLLVASWNRDTCSLYAKLQKNGAFSAWGEGGRTLPSILVSFM